MKMARGKNQKNSYLLDVKKQRNSSQFLPNHCQIDRNWLFVKTNSRRHVRIECYFVGAYVYVYWYFVDACIQSTVMYCYVLLYAYIKTCENYDIVF